MANISCLGLYVEENLIKYAKVSKDHDNIKVEAFGIKFYEKIGERIAKEHQLVLICLKKCITTLICLHCFQKMIYKKQ